MSTPGKLYLVRHGRATAGFDQALDPGLDDTGRIQARRVAGRLAPLGPLPILTSPLRRARETAAPFETRWRETAVVESRVAEIPAPTNDLRERSIWLRRAMAGTWGDLSSTYQAWRDSVIAALIALPGPAIVTTHFIAINAAVGAALGDDRVVCFHPDNCSCTIIETGGGTLRLVCMGRQRETRVL